MQRALAFVVCASVVSCSARMGPELRPASAPRPVVAIASRTLHKRRAHRPIPPPTPPSAPSRDPSATQLCVDEINRYRASLGLRPLERAPDRESCADGQIRDDAQSGHWHGSFGGCGESMQNECNSSANDRAGMIKGCLRDMWNEGPGGGHYENMKNASATKVWCGFYTTPNGGVWSVQDFR